MRLFAFIFCVLALAAPVRAEDVSGKINKLLDGLDAKAAGLREASKKDPDLGLDKIADDLEARAKVLRKAGYAKGWTMGDASAYVSLGNKIYVTDNFLGNIYNDEERMSILLHEAIHLEQGLWDRKFKFWGPSAEVPAYEDEFKWLNVLGVGSSTNKFEILNALQALREYKAITADDKTADLEKRVGLTPEQMAFFNPKPSGPGDRTQEFSNDYYSFSLPGGWKVSWGDDDARKRYAHMTKETEVIGGMGITVTLGVRMTLGEVLGADYFDPGIEKVRNDEMGSAQKWNFTGADLNVVAKAGSVAGYPSAGFRRTETTTKEDKDGKPEKKVMITEKHFFKKGKTYYFLETYYDQKHAKHLDAGLGRLQATLIVK
ncbi:MAG: hypothetical protein WC943_01535 [Elusimicrobiota bacterium]|jgi:hypothetical protein